MTQQTDSVHTPSRRFWLQSLPLQSLSWLGVFSLLSSNLVLAQTPSTDPVFVLTVEDSPPPVSVVPVKKAAPNKPQTAPAPARLTRLRQQLSSTPAPARLRRQRTAVATPPAPQSIPIRQKSTTNLSTNYSNAYIDPTNYSIGATRGYEAPSRVVISERSTGCQAILRQGQGLSGSICGTAPRRTKIATSGTHLTNSIRLARPQTPNWVRRSQGVAVAAIAPVRIGPISVSTNGFSATRRMPPSLPGQISLRNMPWPAQSSVDYYNPTVRPIKPLSNANTGMTFPLTIPSVITSIFGLRIHPITNDLRFHAGTDLGAPLGTPVLAAYAGSVALADLLGGYGLTVVLDHNKSTQQTLYGHLSEIFVQPGEWIDQGTVIGRVGSSGNSTGPHLHFELREKTTEGWVATDPGVQLEYAVAQLMQALQTAQAPQQPQNGG